MKTNYKVATQWLRTNLILLNNIHEIDEDFMYNLRFDALESEEDEEMYPVEIYQYFLTSCSEYDVKYLEEHFGLKFGYSPKLDLYVLCVTHYGTAWDYVYCETDIPQAVRELGEEK